jgi:2Fe-2S ferredoxin
LPFILFAKKHRAPIQVTVGDNLMQSLLKHQVPVASSCNGDGVCAKCRLNIVSGKENLSGENETEKVLRDKFQLRSDQRISCQTEVTGDVMIDATYW